jgi:hypothetical protein
MARPAGRRVTMMPTRRVDPFLKDALKRHARHAGEIIWCWNILMDQLFELLVALLIDRSDVRARLVAYGIWTPLQSDSAKREVILSIAEGVLEKEREQLEAVKWLLNRTSDLAQHRNDVAHVPVKFGLLGVGYNVITSVQSWSTRRAAVQRLTETPTAAIWQRARGDLMALARYCQLLSANIRADPSSPPWPRKPRLLAVPQKKKTSARKRRQPHRKGPKPPPSP